MGTVGGSSLSNEGKSVRVALLGCGTVGGGVVRLIRGSKDRLASRVGAPLEITHVLVRDKAKARVPECDPSIITTDASRVLGDPNVDIVVEIMGGSEPARGYIESAIRAGKSVVSANKMLLAQSGP